MSSPWSTDFLWTESDSSPGQSTKPGPSPALRSLPAELRPQDVRPSQKTGNGRQPESSPALCLLGLAARHWQRHHEAGWRIPAGAALCGAKGGSSLMKALDDGLGASMIKPCQPFPHKAMAASRARNQASPRPKSKGGQARPWLAQCSVSTCLLSLSTSTFSVSSLLDPQQGPSPLSGNQALPCSREHVLSLNYGMDKVLSTKTYTCAGRQTFCKWERDREGRPAVESGKDGGTHGFESRGRILWGISVIVSSTVIII